ncbi:hypothetical protein TrVE_jg2619 [Triparma verrucosa]|uniref:BspA family leucine-rich repeat surface protein n=1 Tax=Triparma verrucosa TaxID=1606542 RepID=A0A9W7BB32_9STRA|nr:hypothetical protein TrVE_jg2619 [Triparma verrucosa]
MKRKLRPSNSFKRHNLRPLAQRARFLPDDVCGCIVSFLDMRIDFDYNHNDPDRYPHDWYPPQIEDGEMFTASQISKGFWIHAVRRRNAVVEQDKLNKDLRTKVQRWCADQYDAEMRFGHISSWDVSGITRMDYLFSLTEREREEDEGEHGFYDEELDDIVLYTSLFEDNILGWDVSNVTSMKQMFGGASAFNGDLSSWNVSNVTSMEGMFASAFNGDLSSWDVSNVTTMGSMFEAASAFNGDLSSWNVSNVTTMQQMFSLAASFDGDLSTWDVSNVRSMSWMFSGASSFSSNISSWNVENVTSMRAMFRSASLFNSDLSRWNIKSVLDIKMMFQDADAFEKTTIENWDVSHIIQDGHLDVIINAGAAGAVGLAGIIVASAFGLLGGIDEIIAKISYDLAN